MMKLRPLREELAHLYSGYFVLYFEDKIAKDELDECVLDVLHETDYMLISEHHFLNSWAVTICPLRKIVDKTECWNQVKTMHAYFQHAKPRLDDKITHVDAVCVQPIKGRT